MSNNDAILDEFLIEANEIFDQLDLDYVALEKNPTDSKLISKIFRAMHTLKGSSRFFSFLRFEKLAHSGESLMSEIRDGALVLNQDMISTLLDVSDRLRQMVSHIGADRMEPQGVDDDLIAAVDAHLKGQGSIAVGSSKPDLPVMSETQVDVRAGEQATLDAFAQQAAKALDATPSRMDQGTPAPLDDDAHGVTDAEEHPENDAMLKSPIRETDGLKSKSTDVAAPVKVSVEILDTLMNLVSEMVLARNRLLSFAQNSTDVNFSGTVRTIDMITVELQERMMKTRMQPISHVWGKFPRLVRDIAQECDKRVDLFQVGAETELDRTLIESIRDPLVHIIRNSIDHGIELPAERLAKGKSETGNITLRAMHENGMVVIEIVDDGAGINIPLVAQKAISKGIVSAERVAKLSDREILDLIFLPGFSTKESITNLSGRGVGMDVVKNNIQQIGGTVDIATSSSGTKFSLRIPLTLAIMPAVFVRSQNQRFAIPQNNLFEMVRQEPKDGIPVVEDYYDVPVFRLRNKLIPLLVLGSELNLTMEKLDPKMPLNIVVVQTSGVLFGLVVDEVLYMQEVVVKPVGPLVKGINIYSGATILGDGRVSLIFDIAGLAIRSGLISKVIDKQSESTEDETSNENSDLVPMLLFDLENIQRIGISLDAVDRLELIPGSRVEHRGDDDVVIYGDKIMKLIWPSVVIEGTPRKIIDYNEKFSVIVHMYDGQPIGLVVNNIHDIMGVPPVVTMLTPPQAGLVGSTIVGDHVISVLNLPEILSAFGMDAIKPSQFADSQSRTSKMQLNDSALFEMTV